MKKLIFCAAIGCMFVLFSCNSRQGNFYESDELRQLVIDYGEAMNALALSSRGLGYNDEECQWAIDTVSQIWKNCKSQPFDFLQYMADIAMMETYFAYGIKYVPEILYRVQHPDYSQNISGGEQVTEEYVKKIEYLQKNETFRENIKENGDWHDYFLMRNTSLYLVGLWWNYFIDVNDIAEEYEPYFINWKEGIDSFYTIDYITPEYYARIVDGASSVLAYAPFINVTSKPDEKGDVSETINELLETIDEYYGPLVEFLNNGTDLPELTQYDDEDFIKNFLPLQTKMLKMLTDISKTMEDRSLDDLYR